MKVQVLLFAQLRDLIGRDRIEIDVNDGAALRDLVDVLADKQPSIQSMRSIIAYAVNERYANLNTPLHEGCIVALIPPVSGG